LYAPKSIFLGNRIKGPRCRYSCSDTKLVVKTVKKGNRKRREIIIKKIALKTLNTFSPFVGNFTLTYSSYE